MERGLLMSELSAILDEHARLIFATKLRCHGFTTCEVIEASPEAVAELLRQAHEEALAIPSTRSPDRTRGEFPD